MRNGSLHLDGVKFPSAPPIGTVFELGGSQPYRLARVEGYQRGDGKVTALLHWATTCPDTGQEFEVTTGLGFSSFPARRAPGARKPGVRATP